MARKKTEVVEEVKEVATEKVVEEKPKKTVKQPKKCGTVIAN